MADYVTKFAYRYRKGLAATSMGIRQTATTIDSLVPTVTSGAGVPSATEPDGSIYLRTDGSDATDSLYQMIASSWTALVTS